MRQEKAVLVLEEIQQWLLDESKKVLPKSVIGKAISYTFALWKRLKRYIEDGRYEIDNNLVENSIRPVALRRKKYLFDGSHKAAQNAAMMYSFFASCKLNQVNPQEWLKYVLDNILDHKANRLHELLPNNYKKYFLFQIGTRPDGYELNVSYSWFRKKFEDYTGLSPAKYQMQHRDDLCQGIVNPPRFNNKRDSLPAGI